MRVLFGRVLNLFVEVYTKKVLNSVALTWKETTF